MVAIVSNPNPQVTADAILRMREKKQEDGRRKHLGGSLIGRDCDRQLWYIFRWAFNKKHDGRLLRLFMRGHKEEFTFVDELKSVGVEIHEHDIETGNQWKVEDCNGHFGGSLDGIATGLLEAPKTPHVIEMKTFNDKTFKWLLRNGVEKAKPEHYAQMQVYMYKKGLTRAFYMAVNKNDDEVYTERLSINTPFAIRLIAKADRIINSDEPPITTRKADFYECKWCDFSHICHQKQRPERNCRTCLHSTPVENGNWSCAKHEKILDDKEMRIAQPCHRYLPDLVPMVQTDHDGENIIYEGWIDDGTEKEA